MAATIKFGGNTLPVESCYVFSYNSDRIVLRLEILDNTNIFQEIEKLKTNSSDIQHFEDDMLKNIHQNFTGDFIMNYANGKYSIEITKLTQKDIIVNQLASKLLVTQLALAEIYQETKKTLPVKFMQQVQAILDTEQIYTA